MYNKNELDVHNKKDFQLHHIDWNKKIFFKDVYRIEGTDDADECCIRFLCCYNIKVSCNDMCRG